MAFTYSLPKNLILPPNQLRLLCFDPGSVNMGVSVIGCDKTVNIPKVIANSILLTPVHDIKLLHIQGKAFKQEIENWITTFKPQGIIAERFQSRGLKGSTVEAVNVMLGIIFAFNLPLKLITAPSWKNNFQKRFAVELKDIYKQIPTTPHQLDSALIGFYGMQTCFHKDLDFTLEDVIEQVQATSLVLKVNKRKLKQ